MTDPKLELKPVAIEDAGEWCHLQDRAFSDWFDRYHVFPHKSVEAERLDLVSTLKSDNGEAFFIDYDGKHVGGVTVVHPLFKGSPATIAPFFVIPQYQNRGIGSDAMKALVAMFPGEAWRLSAISEDAGAERFYTRLGFKKVETEEAIGRGSHVCYYTLGDFDEVELPVSAKLYTDTSDIVTDADCIAMGSIILEAMPSYFDMPDELI